ncbi:hypothetical protein HPB50_000438 [Hyalomma asiaticum]|uniref:Uncharacterized protein n=1 Tax=Hyalomma asiaticum TaxID=266040 RepID=A0ACB7RL31_HYAAI|nr:hypothetical protein HPB50_000438 [Hyalomma asiaticum]
MTGSKLVVKITEDITLNLERSSVLADELVFVTSAKEKDIVETEGVLGSELRIKPLLEGERSLEGQIPHMIYEVEERASSIGPGNKTVTHNNGNSQDKEETFVVEIHIISDKEHQHSFKKNQELIAYLAIMTNADDAFLTTIKGFMDADATLRGLVKYKKDGKVPGNADVLFLVTGMGSDHDESPECPWEEGYLMSYVDGGLKRYRPSPCSEKAMRQVYKKLSKECKEIQAKRSYMDQYKQFPGQTVRERHYCNKITKHHGKKGFIKKEGIINHKLRIKPVPEGERSLEGRIPHKVYEVEETSADPLIMEKEIFVYPTILQERASDANMSLRLNDEITLNLRRSSALAEELVFVTTTEEVNHLEQEGIINYKLRIKPVPEGKGSLQGQMLHKMYEVKETNVDSLTMGHDTTPRCPWEQGYLMSYVDGGVNKYRLSPCSEDSIRGTYRKLSSECRQVLNNLNYMDKHTEYPAETVREKYYCRKRIKQAAKGLKVKAFPMKVSPKTIPAPNPFQARLKLLTLSLTSQKRNAAT